MEDDEEFRRELAKVCGIKTRKTLDKKISQLLGLGWFRRATDDDKRIHIWNFGTLQDHFGVESTLVHNARVDHVVSSKKRFRATIFAILVGAYVGQRKYGLVRNATHITGATQHPKYVPGKGEKFSPESLSVSFLGRRLDKSKATIHRRKKEAMELGLMSRLKHEHKFSSTADVQALRHAFPDDAYRIQISKKDGCAKIQLSDQLSTPLRYKTRRA